MGWRRTACFVALLGCSKVVAGPDAGVDAAPDATSSHVAVVVAGDFFTCALVDGSTWCWGSNVYDAVTFAPDAGGYPSPSQRADVPLAVSACASTGQANACVVTAAGEVYCWGQNFSGQLGNGTTSNDGQPPAKVQGLTGVTSVACGHDHTCALTQSGRVFCWGRDDLGQLGDGAPDGGPPAPHDGGAPFPNESAVPVAVTNLTDATAIAAGDGFTCALAAGDVWCWGSGLVPGDPWNYVPTLHSFPSGATMIAAGESIACGVAGAKAYCWGNGVLGDGNDAVQTDVPVEVAGVPDAVSVATNGAVGCVMTSVGDLWCWGNDLYGGVGDGTLGGMRLQPVRIAIPKTSAVSVGWLHACAITSSGLMCWGDDGFGELGDGLADGGSTSVSTPMPVAW